MDNVNSDKKNLKFEDAYKRLDEIARLLEDGNTPLEESFKIYEEGQELIRKCHEILDQAEIKLKAVKEKQNDVEAEEIEFE